MFSIIIFLSISNSIKAQKFQVLNQLETLCKCGNFEISDTAIQGEMLRSSEFFLGNAKNAMLSLNYYVFKKDQFNIETCINKLCELGTVIDDTFITNCKNLASFMVQPPINRTIFTRLNK